jgi:Holliday junction resolvase
MNCCQKGKRGERAWRDELRAHGYEARRGQQFSGSPDSPDVVCPDLAGFHFEVKAVERLNVHQAMAQALDDAGQNIPVVAHKRNRGDWRVTMRADDWFELLRRAQPAQVGLPQVPVPSKPGL